MYVVGSTPNNNYKYFCIREIFDNNCQNNKTWVVYATSDKKIFMKFLEEHNDAIMLEFKQ